jgi:hypothetical protein
MVRELQPRANTPDDLETTSVSSFGNGRDLLIPLLAQHERRLNRVLLLTAAKTKCRERMRIRSVGSHLVSEISAFGEIPEDAAGSKAGDFADLDATNAHLVSRARIEAAHP